MNILVLTLFGFAVWTLLVLLGTVGVYRWNHILRGSISIERFRAGEDMGSEFYRRAMRAHANCVENLPVYGAIVLTACFFGISGYFIPILAVVFLTARIFQTLIHVLFPETGFSVSVRFGFFLIQIICMLAMAVIILAHIQIPCVCAG